MQYFNNPPPQESEDCLYLDVYAPATPAPNEGRTVMFWLYGGGLVSGMVMPLHIGLTLRETRQVVLAIRHMMVRASQHTKTSSLWYAITAPTVCLLCLEYLPLQDPSARSAA